MTQPAAGKAAPESATPPAQPVVTDGLINPGSTIGGAGGTFYVDFTLWNPERTRSRVLNALVDTGASYAMIPASILAELGIEPEQTKRFQLANGETQDFPVGSAGWNWTASRKTSISSLARKTACCWGQWPWKPLPWPSTRKTTA